MSPLPGMLIILLIVFGAWLILGYYFFNDQASTPTRKPDGDEWPVLAETSDRNRAYMIKALLDDANIESIVEEDTTLGILYGVQHITDYPVRVPGKRIPEARGLLKESSFEPYLVEDN